MKSGTAMCLIFLFINRLVIGMVRISMQVVLCLTVCIFPRQGILSAFYFYSSGLNHFIFHVIFQAS